MKLEKLLSQITVITQIEDLKNQVEALKPFPKDVEQKILQKFRLDWNYNSNAIEGNPYTYGETLTFIMHGITAKGKTMKDHFDVKGHNEGINFILSVVKEERPLTESDIRALHKMILVEPYEVDTITPSGLPSKKMILIGEYKKEPNHVLTKTGETHFYASPEETPFLMSELLKWYHQCTQNKEVHPLVVAALFHHKFAEIHPFDDGNGRMARLLMNLILLKAGFPPVVVRNEDKNNYYEALSLADAGKKRDIVEYFGNLLVHSLTIYIKGAKGENIDEESDLDKEISLFKASLEKEDKLKEVLNNVSKYEILEQSIFPFFINLHEKLKAFDDLFLKSFHKISSNVNGAQVSTPIFFESNIINSNLFSNLLNQVENVNRHDLNTGYHYQYILNGYKKGISNLDFAFNTYVHFENYQYYIHSEGMIIKKKYSEKLTEFDVKELLKNKVKKIIISLKNDPKRTNKSYDS